MNHRKPSLIQTYTLKEVAEFLQLSPRTLYQYIHQGKLKAYKLPSGWRFTEKDVLEFITLHQARATRITNKTEKNN